MNKHLLTLLIICLGIFLPQVVLGDTVPTEGTWGKERYRSIIPQSSNGINRRKFIEHTFYRCSG